MWCYWSTKGGVGCSVIAASMALRAAVQRPTLLVDLGGDQATILGCSPPSTTLDQWLMADNPPPDALTRIEVPVVENLSLLAWSDAASRANAAAPSGCDMSRVADLGEILAHVVANDHRHVIVDLGRTPPADLSTERPAALAQALARRASRSVLVTRACYLALRNLDRWPRPDTVILIAEPGRALRLADVETAVGVPVSSIRWDPSVARAVDAGLSLQRLPRLLRSLPLDLAGGEAVPVREIAPLGGGRRG